ncbi:testis-expressed protein 11 isoform X2 [Callorhinchus milii]|uniref:testis-expressed protein 11 isoform X2 n=1 Tax=Callorhinchus milii TaxID=7868 RepID=UPI001C3F660C|nr:testis-expressed protein 11 isoform X2 [Callorhinchus milii]
MKSPRAAARRSVAAQHHIAMDVTLAFSEIKELAEELWQNKSPGNVEEVIEKLFNKVTTLDEIEGSNAKDFQVEESAINLWNWAVTKRQELQIDDQQRTKLRHVACKLVCLSSCTNLTEVMLRRQVLMATKTGRSWLECRNPLLADGFLDLAVTSLEMLYSRLIGRNDAESDISVHKRDVEKDLLKLHSYQAESAVIQSNHKIAVACIQRCKDMLLRTPKETGYLSLLCYNFGVETYQQKKYEESVFWLSQSYDIGKTNRRHSPSPTVQAKVLRLLANVYLEWDSNRYQEKALSAVILANEENPHPAGLFLKIKIILKCVSPDEAVRTAISDLLGKVSLDVCLEAAKLLMEHGRDALSFDFLTTLSKQFETSHDIGKILLIHLLQLLQSGQKLAAKHKLEDIIEGHYAGKRISPEILIQFHIVLWGRAAKNFEAQNYAEALQWYNYSLSFYPAGQMDQNLAKLQRNRASCYLHLKQLGKAKESVKEAERCDSDSIFTQFSVYKIAILENDIEKAVQAVIAMGQLAERPVQCVNKVLVGHVSATDFLSLAAQIALENNQEEAARKAFEYLCQHSQYCNQVFTALRCLIRLVPSVTDNDDKEIRYERLDRLLTYLNTAHKKLTVHLTGENLSLELKNSEANWFRKIAWNSALQCEDCPSRMREFFMLSYQLSQMHPVDKGVLIGQKTCLLMAAAASLEMGRKAPNTSEQIERLTQAQEHIEVCWEVWRTLKSTAAGDISKDPTETLLLLYEFEARAKLNDSDIDHVLERVLQLQQIEPKTLETLASLSMEAPAHYPSVCRKALKIALSLQKKQPDVDVTRCSKCLHSLIQLSLPTGVSDIESQILEEVWSYCEEALIIIDSTEEYPEVEILWLMTRAWNTGVSLYSLGKYSEAERWCGLGMRFLKYLGSLKNSYEAQMMGLYTDVLDRMDSEKRALPIEE